VAPRWAGWCRGPYRSRLPGHPNAKSSGRYRAPGGLGAAHTIAMVRWQVRLTRPKAVQVTTRAPARPRLLARRASRIRIGRGIPRRPPSITEGKRSRAWRKRQHRLYRVTEVHRHQREFRGRTRRRNGRFKGRIRKSLARPAHRPDISKHSRESEYGRSCKFRARLALVRSSTNALKSARLRSNAMFQPGRMGGQTHQPRRQCGIEDSRAPCRWLMVARTSTRGIQRSNHGEGCSEYRLKPKLEFPSLRSWVGGGGFGPITLSCAVEAPWGAEPDQDVIHGRAVIEAGKLFERESNRRAERKMSETAFVRSPRTAAPVQCFLERACTAVANLEWGDAAPNSRRPPSALHGLTPPCARELRRPRARSLRGRFPRRVPASLGGRCGIASAIRFSTRPAVRGRHGGAGRAPRRRDGELGGRPPRWAGSNRMVLRGRRAQARSRGWFLTTWARVGSRKAGWAHRRLPPPRRRPSRAEKGAKHTSHRPSRFPFGPAISDAPMASSPRIWLRKGRDGMYRAHLTASSPSSFHATMPEKEHEMWSL